MAFSRQHELSEVKGMLQIYRNNHAITNVDANTGAITRSNAGAHAHIHGESSFLDQRARVNTPGEPRTTGTYWNSDNQARATLEILNSGTGQTALQDLDNGQSNTVIQTALTLNTYRYAAASDASNLGPNVPGHVGRNNQARIGAGSNHSQGYATQGFVKVVKGVGGLMQIQTSYPIA